MAFTNSNAETESLEAPPRAGGQACQPAGSGGLRAASSMAGKSVGAHASDTGLVSPVNRPAVSLPCGSGGSHFGIRANQRARRFHCWLGWSLLLHLARSAIGADWVGDDSSTNQSVWGLRGGLQFAISPGGFAGGDGGPRGLIRIGYPTLTNGGYDLLNFIAIEPVVGEARGYSELEKSSVDGHQGKMFWSGLASRTNVAATRQGPGVVTSPPPGVVELIVPLRVEKFDNGAHIRLVLSQRSDAPDELRLTVYAEPDSAPIKSCILTATMGNKARARLLWLKDGSVSSSKIFGDYRGAGFAPQAFFPPARLLHNPAGDALVAISNDETNPAAALDPGNFWEYRGEKVTQYWRMPAAELNDSLRCAVNARFMYWMSQNPVPGGLAFENFELVEDFKAGQQFIFGVTKRSLAELLK